MDVSLEAAQADAEDAAGRRTTDRALRAALGISLARFERDLRRWIAARAGA